MNLETCSVGWLSRINFDLTGIYHRMPYFFVFWIEISKLWSSILLSSWRALWNVSSLSEIITCSSANIKVLRLFCLYIDSSVGIALGYGLDNRVLGFDSRRGLGIFFTTASTTALGSTQPPIKWIWGAIFLGIKRPVREADHSPLSSAELKEWVELYIHFPIHLHGVVLS
jgi:hypothetical protein